MVLIALTGSYGCTLGASEPGLDDPKVMRASVNAAIRDFPDMPIVLPTRVPGSFRENTHYLVNWSTDSYESKVQRRATFAPMAPDSNLYRKYEKQINAQPDHGNGDRGLPIVDICVYDRTSGRRKPVSRMTGSARVALTTRIVRW